MDKEKKLKAAIIGVLNYLEEEKQNQMAAVASIPQRQLNNWSNYGRQMIMINRNGMQRRIVKR